MVSISAAYLLSIKLRLFHSSSFAYPGFNHPVILCCGMAGDYPSCHRAKGMTPWIIHFNWPNTERQTTIPTDNHSHRQFIIANQPPFRLWHKAGVPGKQQASSLNLNPGPSAGSQQCPPPQPFSKVFPIRDNTVDVGGNHQLICFGTELSCCQLISGVVEWG